MANSCSSFFMQLHKYSDVDTFGAILMSVVRVTCWLAK